MSALSEHVPDDAYVLDMRVHGEHRQYLTLTYDVAGRIERATIVQPERIEQAARILTETMQRMTASREHSGKPLANDFTGPAVGCLMSDTNAKPLKLVRVGHRYEVGVGEDDTNDMEVVWVRIHGHHMCLLFYNPTIVNHTKGYLATGAAADVDKLESMIDRLLCDVTPRTPIPVPLKDRGYMQ